jgi:predicted adenine nucleotide alpha hydrolase (AANH) superfamily ATPase
MRNLGRLTIKMRNFAPMKQPAIQKPEGLSEVLLHACCAPCSSAIVEWMLANGVRPVIYYFNPNIYPSEEYEIRKNESKRHAESLGLRWIDGDYNHEEWREGVCGLEGEPERGRRCEQCFKLRMIAAARKAQELNIPYFTTTLASSRWKSLDQINQAGLIAEQAVEGVKFWAQNWRKGGLYERRNQLLKEYRFYNQQYCGCEFSMRDKSTESTEK